MIDKNIIIKQLEDLKDEERYSDKHVAEFLKNTEYIKSFYNNHVSKFKYYIKFNFDTIEKYSREYNACLHLSYEDEEYQIIKDIQEHYLDVFWVLDAIYDGFNICGNNCKDFEVRLCIKVLDNENSRNNLIDYIIKFGIIAERDNYIQQIRLTETEKCILRLIYEGNSVPEIAGVMKLSKYTIENHKKAICLKIDCLNLPEFTNKKALHKLNILARDYFN